MTDATKPGKGAWVAHNFGDSSERSARWFRLFGSELAARRYAMEDAAGLDAVMVERLTWGEGRSE